jgi:hypothetical protein
LPRPSALHCSRGIPSTPVIASAARVRRRHRVRVQAVQERARRGAAVESDRQQQRAPFAVPLSCRASARIGCRRFSNTSCESHATVIRVYLISDFLGFNDDDERQLKRIARHNSVALIHVSDPLEQELPPPDRYTVTDGIVRSVLSTGDTRARQRYRDDFLAHTGRLESACHATRSQFIRLSTNEAAVVRLGERLVH